MDFEFIKNTLLGEYYAKFSMDHAIIGRWLQDEIGRDRTKIEQIFGLILNAQNDQAKEWLLNGREVSLTICASEVIIQENALSCSNDNELEEGFELYDCESSASCGLDDFEAMMQQWQDFIKH
jgi:uncharacterized protein